jgi:hypothetical protein
MTKEELAKEFIESLKTYQRAPGLTLTDIWLNGFERGQAELVSEAEIEVQSRIHHRGVFGTVPQSREVHKIKAMADKLEEKRKK